MAQTATSLALISREAWDADTIAKQWYADDNPLSRIEAATDATSIGKQLQVGLWSTLNHGGYTSTGVAGGAINTAGNQGVDQAIYTMTQHFFPISLEVSALNQVTGGMKSLISAKNIEIQGAIASLRTQETRQFVTNADGKVAACGAATAAAIPLTAAASEGATYGYQSLKRKWITVGSLVDVGVVGDTDSVATAATVTALSDSTTAPTITTSAGSVTVDTSTFIYIANPNSTTAANPELNGLRNLVNTTGAVGGINPSTAGEEWWKSPSVDTSTSVFSLDLALSLAKEVKQESGETMTNVWTGLKQQMNFYSLLQNQVRFAGDMSLGAGNVNQVKWNNMTVEAYNAILDTDWYCLTLSDFCRVVGDIKKPTWMSQISGDSSVAGIWNTGNTNFVDALFFAQQIGVRRRNTHTAATRLTA